MPGGGGMALMPCEAVVGLHVLVMTLRIWEGLVGLHLPKEGQWEQNRSNNRRAAMIGPYKLRCTTPFLLLLPLPNPTT